MNKALIEIKKALAALNEAKEKEKRGDYIKFYDSVIANVDLQRRRLEEVLLRGK